MKKLLLYFFILGIFNYQSAFSQLKQEKGIHQEQREQFKRDKDIVSKFDISGKGIIPLQKKQAKDLSKIVFGFLPDWEYTKGAHDNLHYDLLSHLAVFNFLASSAGNLTNPSGWPWTDVINASHTNGVKVILTVTNFGGTDAAADVAHTLMTNTTAKNNLFSKIKSTITTYQLDGVNIDFEAMNADDRGDILNTFMADLTSYIHTQLPGKEVSFDGPAVNWSGWKLDGLTQSVDHVFIMAYDYHGGWSDNTGAVAPLTHPSGGICLTKTLNSDYSVPLSKYPEKLILGVPYYGKHWKTATSSAGSAVTSYVGSTFYIDDITDSAAHGGYIWDNASQTPWYRWNSGGWNQVWSDNETSLSKKYDLALTENLGGIGIWALNYDGNRSELWSLINTKFNGATTPIPGVPKSVAAIRKNGTTITLNFEEGNYASSYQVFQSTDNSNYTMVKEATGTSIDVTGLTAEEVYYFKLQSKNSEGTSNQTKVVAVMPSLYDSDILIVDGVERRSFDAVVQYDYPLSQLGRTFSSASNEAVTNGVVDMKDFNFVIWMLLDESTTDETFSHDEQTKVKDFIDNNGVFIVSGSEIGWDLVEKGDATDKSFYETYLKAEYLRDDPGASGTYYKVRDTNSKTYNFDDGTHGTQQIDWPDLIKAKNGSSMSFSYEGVTTSTGYAGVSDANGTSGVEYLAFPIETVYNDNERKDLLDFILQKYSSLLAVDDVFIKTNLDIYPNPTSGLLKISNPNSIKINRVEVYNIYGQKVGAKFDNNTIDLNYFKPGVYLVNIQDENGKQGTFKVVKN